jgi:DNA invertase Pin-like site-specific DNA recombinase
VSFLEQSKNPKILDRGGFLYKAKNFFEKIFLKIEGSNIMKYAYIRVSTIEQNLDRQLEAMKRHEIPAKNYFTEKVSGKDTNRPELQRLLATVKEGDTIYIHDFSRLSRSTSDLLRIVELLTSKGVHLVSNKENLDTSTPTGKLMLTMIGAINEFERTNLLERQKEGIACAKDKGTYKKKDIDRDALLSYKRDVDSNRITVKAAAEMLGITRKTWYRLVKDLELAV